MSDRAKEYLKDKRNFSHSGTALFTKNDLIDLLQQFANQETEQLQKEVERLKEISEKRHDLIQKEGIKLNQLKQTNKELIDFVKDANSFASLKRFPHECELEAMRVTSKQLLTKTKER